jgi:cell wall-associated NlpC family hydrolase
LSLDRLRLVSAARDWLGVPYQHEGRSRTGVDCYGLLIVVAQETGFPCPVESGYGLRPSPRHIRNRLDVYAVRIRFDEISTGDVLWLKYGAQPMHFAIVSCTDPMRIIHSDSVAGKVVEHVLDERWQTMIRGAYRVVDNG